MLECSEPVCLLVRDPLLFPSPSVFLSEIKYSSDSTTGCRSISSCAFEFEFVLESKWFVDRKQLL